EQKGKRTIIIKRVIKNKQQEDIKLNCDGRKCGQGRAIQGGSWICPCNNLEARFPELIEEWDDINGSIYNYTTRSHKRVSWICSNNLCGCHVWEAVISSRTGTIPSGCPFCCQ